MRRLQHHRGEAIHRVGIVVAILALAACSASSNGNPGTEGTEGAEDASGPMGEAAASGASGEDAQPAGDDATAAQSGSGSPSGSGTTTANPPPGSGSSSGSGSASGVGSSGAPGPDAGGSSGAKSGSSSGAASGSSSGSASGSSSGSSSGAPSGATFTMVYTSVLSSSTYKCTSCHGDDAPMMSFASKSAAYSDLVGVSAQGRSCGTKSEKRVVAGSSATSLLYAKIAGTQTCGSRMPEASGFTAATNVSTADLALVKSWIDSGALNN